MSFEFEQFDELFRDVNVRDFVGAANVVNLPQLAFEQHELKRPGHVGHVQEVAGVGASPVQGHGPPSEQLVGELGNEFFGELVGAVHVVAAGDDHRQVEGAVVGLDQELGGGLGGRVRVGRLEHMLFFHRLLVGFAWRLGLS